jgi:CheY-like chemotaxis protein
MNILLVDDDDVSQEAVIRSFAKNGIDFPVVTAVDGQEAWEILNGQHVSKSIDRPYVVLLDLNMPRMNGFELLNKMRNDKELMSDVVFILTTSNADADRAKAYEEYIAGYMVKSFVGPKFKKLASLMSQYASSVVFP